MPFVAFEGDESVCATWLPYAQREMLRFKTTTQGTRTIYLTPVPEVTIELQTRPDRIRIMANNALKGIVIRPASDDAVSGWGTPLVDDNGTSINPPVGTIGGGRSRHIVDFSKDVTQPRLTRNVPDNLVGGNAVWTSGKVTLSWYSHGGFNASPRPTTYSENNTTIRLKQGQPREIELNTLGVYSISILGGNVVGVSYFAFENEIFKNGKLLAVAPYPVLAAAYINTQLICVCNLYRLLDRIYHYKEGVWVEVGDLVYTDVDSQLFNGVKFAEDANAKKFLDRSDCYGFSEDGLSLIGMAHYFKAPMSVFNESLKALNYVAIKRASLSYNEISQTVLLESVSQEDRSNYFNLAVTSVNSVSETNGVVQKTIVQTNSITNNKITLGVGFQGNTEALFEVYLTAAQKKKQGTLTENTGISLLFAGSYINEMSYSYRIAGAEVATGSITETRTESRNFISELEEEAIPMSDNIVSAHSVATSIPSPLFVDISKGFFSAIVQTQDYSGNRTYSEFQYAVVADTASAIRTDTLSCFSTNGDLRNPLFSNTNNNEYPVLGVLEQTFFALTIGTFTETSTDAFEQQYIDAKIPVMGAAQDVNKGVVGFGGEYALQTNAQFYNHDIAQKIDVTGYLLPNDFTLSGLIGTYGANQRINEIFKV